MAHSLALTRVVQLEPLIRGADGAKDRVSDDNVDFRYAYASASNSELGFGSGFRRGRPILRSWKEIGVFARHC